MNEGRPDEELLARHLDGDRDAFTELVTRHERRVYGICLRVLGNPEDAADATQEAFLAVLRRAASFQGGAAFSTWLYRVAVNAALDLGRRRSRLRTVTLEPEGVPPAAAVEDPGETVATTLTVQAALTRVPEEFRVAIVLCDLCRLPYAEAAAILEVAVGTVKSRVFRGRAALARELHGLDPRIPPGNPPSTSTIAGEGGAGPAGRPSASSGASAAAGRGATTATGVAGTGAGTGTGTGTGGGRLEGVPGTAAALAASDEQAAIQQPEE